MIILVSLLVILGVCVWLGIFQKAGKFKTLQAIPKDAVFKVNIVSVNNVHERLKRNFIWESLKEYPYFEEYHSNLQYMDSLGNAYPKLKKLLADRPVTISCHHVATSNYDFLYVCNLGKLNVIRIFESLLLTMVVDDEVKVNHLKDPNGKIQELVWGNLRFYFAIKDNLLVSSLSRPLVSRSLAQCKEGVAPGEALSGGDLAIEIDHVELGKWMSAILESSSQMDELAALKNTRLTLRLNDENLHFSGETTSDPDQFSFLDVMNSVSGGSSTVKEIVGEGTAAYLSFCFSSFPELGNVLVERYQAKNTQSYRDIQKAVQRVNQFLSVDILDLFTSWIGGEITIIKPRLESGQKGDNIALAVRSKDIDLAKDQMAYLAEQIQRKTPIREKSIEYNGHTIHYFRLKGFFNLFFEGMFNRFEHPYYTFMGNYVVFSNSPSTLAEMIKEYVLGNTLANNEKYNEMEDRLGRKSNVFGYVHTPNTYEYLYESFKPTSRGELEKNKGAFLSFETVGFTLSKNGEEFETQIVANYNEKAPHEYKIRELNRKLENQIDKIEAGFYNPTIPDSISVSTRDNYAYETEQNRFSGNLKEGDLDGVWSVSNKSGHLVGKLPYVAGELDGKAQFFYEDGGILAQVIYDAGEINEYKEFFPDGTLRAEIEFRRGVRHGIAKFYYNTGHLFCEGRYKKGHHTGKWHYYKVTGEKYAEE